MKFKDLHPPILELAPSQTIHRVQLTRARKTSVRINGLLLAPTGFQSGRFCLPSEATAYLADSERSNWTASFTHRPNTRCIRALRCLHRAWRKSRKSHPCRWSSQVHAGY